MEKNKKELIIRILIVWIILIIFVLTVYSFIKIDEKENIKHKIDNEIVKPVIKEEFTSASLKVINTYDGVISVDNKTNEILLSSNDDDIDHYIIGKIGELYDDKISVEKENNDMKYGSYQIYKSKDSYYYINTKNNTKSDYYVSIKPLTYFNSIKEIYDYLILESEDKFSLLSVADDKVIDLDDRIINLYIKEDYNDYVVSNNPNYIIIEDKNNKFGLMKLDGEIVIDFKYDYLSNSINKDEFIFYKDNKFGIINSKDEVILNNEYDTIYYINNYKILSKNNKFGVFYNDKQIVDYTIDGNIDFKMIGNNLYISNKNKSYLINSKGIKKQIDNKIIDIGYIDEENKSDYFFYTVNENNDKLTITFYDNDFYEYYTLNIPYEKMYKYSLNITPLNKYCIYKIKLKYDLEGDISKDKTYYIDLFNSKEINEKDALYEYFDNGYGYILDDNILKIYKNDEVINAFNNIHKYLGNYNFSSINKNKSTIYEIEFKKETK